MIMDMSKGQPTTRYQPPPPDKVEELTEHLLDEWCRNYETIVNAPQQTKVNAIAAFHHKLLYIHPFVDGNGRIARLILTLQIRELLGKDVKIEWPRKEYYDALLAADGGDMAPLVQVIEEVITDSAKQEN